MRAEIRPTLDHLPRQALNMSGGSFSGKLHIGATKCPDVLPRLQRIAVYTTEALAELESTTL